MIFVSVGTLEKPFNRLIKAVDEIADIVVDKIIIQTGYSTYIPEKCEHFDFCEHEKILAYIKTADIIISHSGFGIIGNAIKLGKPMILVPREIKYGEAVDKQYELAEYLATQNKSILCVRDVHLLPAAIDKGRNIQVDYNYNTIIPDLIEEYISNTFT